MAGTLTVQNIEGPSSGANANKVIIPAGQTLDVSGGTMLPSAGQFIQTQIASISGDISTSSTSFVTTGLGVTITPKFSTSKILVSVRGGRPLIQTNAIQLDYKLYEGTSAVDAFRLTSVYHNFNSGGNALHPGGVSVASLLDATDTTTRTYNLYFAAAGTAGTVYAHQASDIKMFLIAQEIAQ